MGYCNFHHVHNKLRHKTHKEGEQLEDQRNVGESSCNSGDGTDKRVQSLMYMMMMIKLTEFFNAMFVQGKVRIINQKFIIPKTNTNFIPPIAYCKNTRESVH